jgi:membrane-bound metal-dependent hydrolase YbcI (DUF457 family)
VPITPFHFGPGALLHAAAPRRVSFMAFVAANCIIDVESIYNVLRGNFPIHRFLHTFVGATLVVAITVALFAGARRQAALPDLFAWRQLSFAAVLVGAALGSYTHIVLDGIMHADMRPFAPWSAANPFLHAIPLGALHLGCVIAGAAGLLAAWLRRKNLPV